MRPELRAIFSAAFGKNVHFNEPVAPHVAYRVGGPADILVFPHTEEDVARVQSLAIEHQLPITIIGRGTNLLVDDAGIRGITVSLAQAFRSIEERQKKDGKLLIRCGGGLEKQELLEWAVIRGWGGLEFSAGVPGSLGGGIYMNAGTKYGCYGDILRGLRLFDFENGPKEFTKEEIRFGYREQSLVTQKTLVSWVDLELHEADAQALRTEVDRIIGERAAKQPLDFPSCGSTFKNPPEHSAGRLIEKAGLKGLTRGGAEVSTKHSNFILNKGNAKAADIKELIGIIKERVYSQFGILLECEVILVGGENAEEKNILFPTGRRL